MKPLKIDQEAIKRGRREVSRKEFALRMDEVERRLQKCEKLEEGHAEFIFQSVSITVGLFAVILAVLIGFSTKWDLGKAGGSLVTGLLVYVAGILTIWYVQWNRSRKAKMSVGAKFSSADSSVMTIALPLSASLMVAGITLIATGGQDVWFPDIVVVLSGVIILVAGLVVYFWKLH